MSSFESTALETPSDLFVPDPIQPHSGKFEPLEEEERDAAVGACGDHEESLGSGDKSEKKVEGSQEDSEPVAQSGREEEVAAKPGESSEEERRSLERVVEAFERATQELDAMRRDYLSANRRLVVDLALGIAEKISGRSVIEDPDALASMVERAITHLEDEGALCVRLSERDLEIVQSGLAPALQRVCAAGEVELRSDSHLARGEVKVEGSHASIDVRISELLNRIGEELEGIVGTGGGE